VRLRSYLLARCRRLRSDSGSALVELALIVSFLGIPLLVGTAEMGILVYSSIEVSNAAHAAAMYGMQSLTFASNTAGMTTVARAEATDFGTAMTVTPTTYYACSNAVGGTQYTGVTAQLTATLACTLSLSHALEFVQVTTNVSVTPSIRLPGLPSTFTLTGSSVMEVEQ
jgi:Flp pilus assembly protein TadG